jgi:hypothetical protein
MFTLILITFQLFEFLFVRNSVVIPNLSSHFVEDELHKLKISTTLKSPWSFLFRLSNVYWKKFDKTKFVALSLLWWWYLIQENFYKDKGNLFYVSITFWMILTCKKNRTNMGKSLLSFPETLVKMNSISNFLNGCSVRWDKTWTIRKFLL